MKHTVHLPLDNGFVRRQCPHCQGQFKWHHGPTDDRPADVPEPLVYHCPLCGESAPPDQWFTDEQVAYIHASATGPVLRAVADELGRTFGGRRRAGRKAGLDFQFKVEHDDPGQPEALQEPADMTAVSPPCHPWEPVKVPDDRREPLHCLVCGEPFALG